MAQQVKRIELLKLQAIRTDGDTQLRAETNQETIQQYAQDMRDGDEFPPIVVFYDGTNYWLSDGYHRYYAVMHLERDEILADIRDGSRRDALLYATEANRKHGMQLTNADKRRIVTLFLNDPEWTKWSDREIARRCGVSHTFVHSIRSSLETVSSERTYTTKYGTVATMNTLKIGSNPYEGLSEIALKQLEEGGSSPEDIAKWATWAREVQADKIDCAAKALIIGGWMLGCKEGDNHKPYTQEQMEKEGWVLWCLYPAEIDIFVMFGEIERSLHNIVMTKKNKDFLDVSLEEILEVSGEATIELLASAFINSMFRTLYSMFHHLTFCLRLDVKEKFKAGDFKTLGEAYRYQEQLYAEEHVKYLEQNAGA